jgi:anaerobic magnesium-protoporphyrin IX monomethyl ester cyclase
MKIILINPPYFDVYKGYEKAARIGASYPPTGLLYLAAILKKNGHDVRLHDMDFETLDPDSFIESILNFKPDLIGITATTPIFHKAVSIASSIKQKSDIPVVLGGIHITICREEAFEKHPEFDYAVIGEGEATMLELVTALENGNDPTTVAGILFRKNGHAVAAAPRPLIDDLNDLSFPSRELIQKNDYMWVAPGRGNVPIATIITKRGCPFRCSFCSQHSMFTRKVRYRSVENVLDELEVIVKVHGIDHIIILDDTLVIQRERMMKMCEGIHERKLKFTWEGMARANLVDKELIETMANAGLVRISFGIESGNEDVLKNIEKGVTLDQIRDAYRWAKKAGIETRGSAIIGHPNETRKTAWQTIKFLRSLEHLDQVYINVMVPYPGTRVYELAKNGEAGYRLLDENYSNYIRYNQAVLEVNDLDREALRKIQNIGLWLFYFTPHRILHALKRAGLRNGLTMGFAMLRGLLKRPGLDKTGKDL